jgi:dienelactone hydrolase
MSPTQISEYEKSCFSANTKSGREIVHDVYSLGQGKICVIIQELPGIGQETLALADRLRKSGYRVVLPHLFGPLGKTSHLNLARVLFCMRKEFHLFAKNRSSPIVDWLAALCNHLKDQFQVSGVGVIGMCLTGNFAISLMANQSVLAAYSSQPSLPLFNQSGLHMFAEEMEKVKTRLDQPEMEPMHCGRFEKDKLCKDAKLVSLDAEFNQDHPRIVLHQLPDKGHSILTLDFVDDPSHPTYQLLDKIIAYFDRQLGTL